MWSKRRRTECGQPSCLLHVREFPGHWTSVLTLEKSSVNWDGLSLWGRVRVKRTQDWPHDDNGDSVYFWFLWKFSRKIKRGAVSFLCVAGPMEPTVASVPPTSTLLWQLHFPLCPAADPWPTNLSCPQRQHNLEAVSMAVEARLQRPKSQVSSSGLSPLRLTLEEWLVNLGNSISSLIHLKSKYRWLYGVPERIQ